MLRGLLRIFVPRGTPRVLPACECPQCRHLSAPPPQPPETRFLPSTGLCSRPAWCFPGLRGSWAKFRMQSPRPVTQSRGCRSSLAPPALMAGALGAPPTSRFTAPACLPGLLPWGRGRRVPDSPARPQLLGPAVSRAGPTWGPAANALSSGSATWVLLPGRVFADSLKRKMTG